MSSATATGSIVEGDARIHPTSSNGTWWSGSVGDTTTRCWRFRSAKVIALPHRAGATMHGRALDCGCGGGGMPMSLAEHVDASIGIDPFNRFGDAGVKLARERGMRNSVSPGRRMALPFRTGSFDLVLSHAVIEHVPDAMRYLQECRRVMAPDGRMTCRRAPYLVVCRRAPAAAARPVPLHWIVGRDIAFRTFRWLARRAPWMLQEPAHENSFIRDARQGIVKHDDLLEKVRVQRLRGADRPGRLPHRPRAAHGERHRQAPSIRNGRVAPRQRADAGLPAQQHRVRAGPTPALERCSPSVVNGREIPLQGFESL